MHVCKFLKNIWNLIHNRQFSYLIDLYIFKDTQREMYLCQQKNHFLRRHTEINLRIPKFFFRNFFGKLNCHDKTFPCSIVTEQLLVGFFFAYCAFSLLLKFGWCFTSLNVFFIFSFLRINFWGIFPTLHVFA